MSVQPYGARLLDLNTVKQFGNYLTPISHNATRIASTVPKANSMGDAWIHDATPTELSTPSSNQLSDPELDSIQKLTELEKSIKEFRVANSQKSIFRFISKLINKGRLKTLAEELDKAKEATGINLKTHFLNSAEETKNRLQKSLVKKEKASKPTSDAEKVPSIS